MAYGRIILASQSPRRGLLLREAGLEFEQCSPPFADPAGPVAEHGQDGAGLARELALSKAISLASVLRERSDGKDERSTIHQKSPRSTGTSEEIPGAGVEAVSTAHSVGQPRQGDAVPAAAVPKHGGLGSPYLIIGADTICVDTQGSLIGQPGSRTEAEAMIRRFTGVWHQVVTGVGLIDDQGRSVSFSDAARVYLETFDEQSLDAYLDSGHWQGKAGGYNLFDRQAAGWPISVEGDPTTVVGLPMALLLPLLRHWQQSGDWEAAVGGVARHFQNGFGVSDRPGGSQSPSLTNPSEHRS